MGAVGVEDVDELVDGVGEVDVAVVDAEWAGVIDGDLVVEPTADRALGRLVGPAAGAVDHVGAEGGEVGGGAVGVPAAERLRPRFSVVEDVEAPVVVNGQRAAVARRGPGRERGLVVDRAEGFLEDPGLGGVGGGDGESEGEERGGEERAEDEWKAEGAGVKRMRGCGRTTPVGGGRGATGDELSL